MNPFWNKYTPSKDLKPTIEFTTSDHIVLEQWLGRIDSSTTLTEEKSLKNLNLLSYSAHTNWQLGDWCLLPTMMVVISQRQGYSGQLSV